MAADTTEKGLEALIVRSLTSNGWLHGNPQDSLRGPNPAIRVLGSHPARNSRGPVLGHRLQHEKRFFDRLKRETGNRGIIDVLRKGIQHGQHEITLFYGTPTPGNTLAEERHRQNRFSVTRQIRYSVQNQQLAVDIVLFVNGLPVATMELKNRFTGQTAADAVEQYQNDRSPQEDLFRQGRCAAHFAVDDEEVRFCAEMKGRQSSFLPFNKGREDGSAGNPVNPTGVRTAYLWEEILTPASLTDILENYAQKVDGRQIWPRYHQLEAVRKILADAKENGAGQKYLIQHSAGSGKSNSIAWAARQLIGVEHQAKAAFDSVIVITDRVALDRQINGTIRQFTQAASTVAHADRSGDLRRFIAEGKKIIVTTVHEFPFVLEDIGSGRRNRNFAIIIDEAHSGQGGKAGRVVNRALAGMTPDDANAVEQEEEDNEDKINRIIESRNLLANASYLTFTATPKNKTLEMFGIPEPQPDGRVRHLSFHNYSMKQAIQEGLIMDVLTNYTPVSRYFNVVKSIEDDPQFDSN